MFLLHVSSLHGHSEGGYKQANKAMADYFINLHIWNQNTTFNVHRKSIPIYIQKDVTFHSLFLSGNCSTCFGWYLHPSSGAHATLSTASGTCQTVKADSHIACRAHAKTMPFPCHAVSLRV